MRNLPGTTDPSQASNNPITLPGTYFVGTNPQWNASTNPIGHPSWASFGDHTTGTGNMLIVNGANVPNVSVWSQTISGLNPGSVYAFATYATSNYSTNPAQLNFLINGNLGSSTFQLSGNTGPWQGFYTIFMASSATETVSIVNQSLAFDGNDFSLDDILVTPYTGSAPPGNPVPVFVGTAISVAPEPTALALLLPMIPVAVVRLRRKH